MLTDSFKDLVTVPMRTPLTKQLKPPLDKVILARLQEIHKANSSEHALPNSSSGKNRQHNKVLIRAYSVFTIHTSFHKILLDQEME